MQHKSNTLQQKKLNVNTDSQIKFQLLMNMVMLVFFNLLFSYFFMTLI